MSGRVRRDPDLPHYLLKPPVVAWRIVRGRVWWQHRRPIEPGPRWRPDIEEP